MMPVALDGDLRITAPLASSSPRPQILSCPECGLEQTFPRLPAFDATAPEATWRRWQVRCSRCRRILYRGHQATPQAHLARTIGLLSAALLFLVVAVTFPIAALDLFGNRTQASLLEAIGLLAADQNWFIAILLVLCTLLLPTLELLILLGLCLFWRRQSSDSLNLLQALPAYAQAGLSILPWLRPWSMLEVLLLGIIVSMVKLQGFAVVIPGMALWALVLFLLLLAAAHYTFNQTLRSSIEYIAFARRPRLFRRRQSRSLRSTWAFLFAATAFYFPANLLPVMATRSAYAKSDDTIFSGVVYLWETDSWVLASIIFIASIVIPLFKILALAMLAASVQWQWSWGRLHRSYLYRFVESIGRWSMLDIFVATMLASLVQLRGLGQIEVTGGATAFAAVVMLTMLAAQSFDPRLLWLTAAPPVTTDDSL
ncbi:paraquat-inducible protein A [Parvibium lacunae]|uniref:Paraquat-inducible protein A n=1 Tax=Parvibium lacunae TaxID=1888893 RepID=A0A368KYR4_9BURK|nr:paraquat-inducible protein A [Parvibium lacunae]RCS56557.1 hypothetical protein DU000_11360 [Parvibium lacunae]